MNTYYKTIKSYILAAAELVFPRYCAVCDRKLRLFEKHLCTSCLADIPYTHYWTRVHNPMADRFNEQLQQILYPPEENAHTDIVRPSYCHAASLFFFNSAALYRHIPYKLKYGGDIEIGLFFGRILGKKLSDSPAFSDCDILIPVPLHWARKWKRGYNQAEIIARGISEVTGIKTVTSVLYRKRRTKTQTKMGSERKAANVRDAFGCREKIRGRHHIVIVDDVFTTGATLSYCYKALAKAAPESVISIATMAMVTTYV